jgi:hypothetical protein
VTGCLGSPNPDLFDAIDNPLRRIPGRERGERSLMCASVPRETDRLVSRLVSNPSFCERDRPQAAKFNA